jgi:polyphosphate kinase
MSRRSSPASRAAAPAAIPLIDRDLSTLAFNERVLSQASRADVPLLERLRYLCIVSSNLDEFFEVRSVLHLEAFQAGLGQGPYTATRFETVHAAAHRLVETQYRVYNHDLLAALKSEGIEIVPHGERTAAQRRWVAQTFDTEVRPLLVPVGLDPSHPFPQVANKSLNFIVRLGGEDAFGRANEIAIVKVPRVLPRFFAMPAKVSGKRRLFVSISSVIRSHLADLFPGRQVLEFSQFRVTRNSDLSVDEDDVKNLRTALRQELAQRHFGEAMRLEVSSGCSAGLVDFLLGQFHLPPQALYRVAGPVNLVRLSQLIDLVDAPAMRFAPYQPSYPAALAGGGSIFARLRNQGDVLIHQPYESFEAVLAFLREAVRDPRVLAIKQTIYRTGADSELMELLRTAVLCGKEVTAVVELKARFDEEANINWAERLESIGAQVVYGIVGLKTHAKMMLVTRREEEGHLRHYAHLSTGNYNPRTARLYTDLSQLTADPQLTADIEQVFRHLAIQNRLPRLHHLWVAPFHLHSRLIGRISAMALAAAQGQDARIVLKMNSLTDEKLARALIDAGRRGVQIDLIVRGACILPPGVPGQTGTIRVRSLIGRFLEHSRVFWFKAGEDESLHLASADWMNRNMMRRVELAWPVLDPALRQRVIDECLNVSLCDTLDAWELSADGHYQRVAAPAAPARPFSAQRSLMLRHGSTDAESR